MRIGVFAPPWGPTASPADLAAIAEAAERLGYPSLWVGDHVVFPRRVTSTYPYNESGNSPFDPDGPLLDSLTLLAWLAGKTTDIDLGVSVLVLPMRNPVEIAKLLADVAALSNDRLAVGVGAGWMREEFDTLGADFDHRGRITDEWIAIMRHLWEGRRDAFAGTFYRFDPVGFEPRPGRLPIIVGGNSAPAMRRAARNDGWHALRMAPEDLAPRVLEVRAMVAAEGRDPDRFDIVHRGPLLTDPLRPPEAGADVQLRETVARRLDAYRRSGVTELIVEWPEATTAERLAWMAWLVDTGLTGPSE
jgi:probable F420-dependent oxidoreductase